MLVYANYLEFCGAEVEQAILRAIGAWLKEMIGYGLRPEKLREEGEYEGRRNEASSVLRIRTSATDEPAFYSWVVKNQDDTVSGRQWVCEVGLRSRGDEHAFSVVLKTEEHSTRVSRDVQASRPRLVKYVLRNVAQAADAALVGTIPGAFLKRVGEDQDSYRALRSEVERQERNFPIVLVSPNTDGEYLVDPEPLREVLTGLADVVQASSDFNSYEMAEILGQRWSAWNGAVNLIYPRSPVGFISGRLFLSREIETWGDKQHDRRSELLAWVTTKTNLLRVRQRIRPEGVEQMALQRRLAAMRARASKLDDSALREEFNALQTLAEEQSEQISEFEAERRALESQIEEAQLGCLKIEDDLVQTRKHFSAKEFEVQSLKDLLAQQGGGRSTSFDANRLLAVACRTEPPTPTECLEVIQGLFGDHCLVLETAYSSAAEMDSFALGRRLLAMLRLLVTDYREILMASGDNQARKVFGNNDYSAKESETVMNSPKMKRQRIFEYQGTKVEMFRHLKIGVDDDMRRTIRVHFYWDSNVKKIIIGYCGKHLSVASH